MSILEHIGELRNRLAKSCIALVVGTLVAFSLLYEPVIDFLLRSYCALPATARIGSVAEDGGCRLAALSPLEPLSIRHVAAGDELVDPVVVNHESLTDLVRGLLGRSRPPARTVLRFGPGAHGREHHGEDRNHCH